jgi:LytS/YehU family sensor histidine kinase
MYLLISITTTAHYYFYEIRRKEKDIASLKDAYQRSKLISLNTEIDPHMIFNSLNNICTTISANNVIAKEKIVELSKLLRENLKHKNKVFTTLEYECNYIEKYIQMYNKGRDKLCKVNLYMPAKLKMAIIPKMVLQPIVENAIKHSKFSHSKPLIIKININEEKSNLKIHISNNGEINSLQSKNENLGIGLNNIINRLKIIYQNQFTFNISEQYNLFTCFIRIPLKMN